MNTPRIVCLCGSIRFYRTFQEANFRETMKGNIVLSVGFYPHAQNEMHGEQTGITPEQKEALDALHFRKIELADEVLVLNVGRYIGDSTRREIAHCSHLVKPVRYWMDENPDWVEPKSPPIVQYGPKIFRWHSFDDWASGSFRPVMIRRNIQFGDCLCLDANNTIIGSEKDFAEATYPVTVYLARPA